MVPVPPDTHLSDEALIEQIIASASEVHRALGPGLLESIYQLCLAEELTLRKLPFEQDFQLMLDYKGVHIDTRYRMDFIVQKRVVVELKAAETLLPVHEAQLRTYVKVTGCKLGLLINFGVPDLSDGLLRLAL